MEILPIDQGSEEWLRVRMGIPTASQFQTVISKSLGGEGEPKGRREYMLKLIGERITGEPSEHFSNKHTDRGHAMEGPARELFQFLTDYQCTQVGFIKTLTRSGWYVGCSPDSLIGEDGMLEIKSKLPHRHLETVLNNKIPPDHYAQCQGALWVAERSWIAFMSYWPKMDPFIQIVERDEPFITHLAKEVDEFCADLDRVERVVRGGRIRGPVSTHTPRSTPFGQVSF